MNGNKATVICDSLINGVRVTTMEVRFPRFILPEFNTHRVFSRNSASSRARSIKRTFVEVMEDPFVPQPFTKNQKGMSGAPITDDAVQEQCCVAWLRSRDAAVLSALDLLVGQARRVELMGDDVARYQAVLDAYEMESDEPSVHKQHVNRLLEPFMYHTVIVTSSMWDNFFELRIAPAAQPEIYDCAQLMLEAYRASTPVVRSIHLPYVDVDHKQEIEPFDIKLSVASCASVSYKSPDELSEKAAGRIFDVMAADKHLSPFEHQACTPEYTQQVCDMLGWDISTEQMREAHLPGNLSVGVVQLRKLLELTYQAS